MRQLNPTALALLGGLVLLLLVIAYFASNRNPDQDKLTGRQTSHEQTTNPEKKCGATATYDLIKRELFRRAAQMRGSDQGAYDELAAYAVVRVENPAMETEDDKTGAINCTGTLFLDLPPGVAVVGGRRSLMSDVDYTIQPAADGSGDVILLRNADSIIAPLATLARVAEPQDSSQGMDMNAVASAPAAPEQPQGNGPVEQAPRPEPSQVPSATKPGFDCAKARTKSELAICSDGGLAALDARMSSEYRRAFDAADPREREILRSTRDRFLSYRDRCPNRQCMTDAYAGRMREIRDIMEGRWQPPR